MKRSTLGLIFTLALGLLAAPLPAKAQQSAPARRIGLLHFSPASSSLVGLGAFRKELRKYGWIEGQNLFIECRFAEGKVDRLAELVAELARLNLELIVTVTTTATRAAMQVIKATPIVFTVVADPVTSGFVSSLAQPGGNATGPSAMGPDLAGKQLELLKETVPAISRVAVLWEPTNPGVALIFHQMQRDAQRLGLTLQSLEVRSSDDFELVFTAMTRDPLTLWCRSLPP